MSGSLRARAPGSLPLPKAASESAPVPAASSSIAQTADGPSPFPQEFLSCPARFLLSRRGGGRYQLAGASVTQACRKHTVDVFPALIAGTFQSPTDLFLLPLSEVRGVR